ncbi:MAG: YXWGXW repeat-containing protein [Rhodospirillaceae bacterium]
MTGRILTALTLAAFIALPVPANAKGGNGPSVKNGQPAAEVTTTYKETIEHYSVKPGDARVIAPSPPPSSLDEPVPPPPLGIGRYVWQSGHWTWAGGEWAWRPGTYVEATQGPASWIPEHWVEEPEGWVRIDGHWQ